MIKEFGSLTAGALVGQYVYVSFVLKSTDDAGNSRGFIEESPGLGLDDLVHAVTIAAFCMLALKVIGS